MADRQLERDREETIKLPLFSFLTTGFLLCLAFLLCFGVGVRFLIIPFMHHPPNKRKHRNVCTPVMICSFLCDFFHFP